MMPLTKRGLRTPNVKACLCNKSKDTAFMTTPHLPNTRPSLPKFRVLRGLHLELNVEGARLGVSLTPDEALSLSLVLLYEAREMLYESQRSGL